MHAREHFMSTMIARHNKSLLNNVKVVKTIEEYYKCVLIKCKPHILVVIINI